MGRRFVACVALVIGVGAAMSAALADPGTNAFGAMHWRMIGPFRGGRTTAIAGVAGKPDILYSGAVAGGVWKTVDAGRTWQPIFDAEDIASIGAIAVAPSNPDVVYVGSGEADMRSDITYGDGMYKSTDAGKTWSRIGLTDTRQIARIAVSATDPNTLFVAALGHSYGPNSERGVYRSSDGGQTWQRVLYKGENTGAIDVEIDPNDANTVIAALWQTRRPPWNVYPPSNGPGGGLYISHDGGTTWKQVAGSGFPTGVVGRMGIAFAPSDSATLAPGDDGRSRIATLAPADANSRTVASPSPEPPPVTSATAFLRFISDLAKVNAANGKRLRP